MVFLPSSFSRCVEEAWNGEIIRGSRLFSLVTKLKCLKVALRLWNKQIFGQIESNILELEARIKGLEDSLQIAYSEMDLLVSKVELSDSRFGWIGKSRD